MFKTTLPLLLGAASLSGQSSLVLPPGLNAREGNSRGSIAGFDARFRQQILVKGADLLALVGHPLEAVWFRRDQALGVTFQASSSQLQVQVSVAARPAVAPASTFAANRGPNPAIVFNGIFSLPAAPASTGPAPWSTPHAVRIPFATPFPYHGGDLCIEIDGTPAAAPPGFFWSVDYEHSADSGTVVAAGAPCGAAIAMFPQTASAWGRNMVPGSTFVLSSIGEPQTPGVLLVSTLPLPGFGWSLGGIGPGCALYLTPAVQVPVLYPAQWGSHVFTAAHVDVQLPRDPSLLRGQFYVQWGNLVSSSPARLTTTNRLDITLGATLPNGAVSTVMSDEVAANAPLPSTGRVHCSRGPVLRFEAQ